MVFFTCNNCGDSLKKKDCANHAGKCYPLALTCIDCHKDFFGNDFVAHTSCVTEAEKYGVKGFVSRAPSTSGAAKQEQWTCAILAASKISSLTIGQRRFLGTLANHGNVPRKKKPFQNFARNLWRDSTCHLDLLDQVFGIVESEFQKIKNLPGDKSTSKAKTDSNEEIKGRSVNNADEPLVDSTKNKESEGKKQEAIVESNVKAIGSDDIVDDPSISSKKSRKGKENVIDAMKELKENEIEPISEKTSNDTVIKKSKKKKHKKQSAEQEKEVIKIGNDTLEKPVDAGDGSTNGDIKKKKKKKHKHSAEAEEEVIKTGNDTLEEPVNAEDDSADAEIKKKKKKKHKHSAEAEEKVIKNGLDTLKERVNAEDDSTSSKMKKKRKKSPERGEAIKNGNGTLEEPVNAEDGSNGAKSKKKKKKCKISHETGEVIKNGNGTLEEPVNAEDGSNGAKSEKKSKKKLAKAVVNGSDDLEDLSKKSKKLKHKHEENAVESVEDVDDHDETPAKDASKKSKKKKLKLQEGEECVPRKKSKSTSG